MKIKTEPIPTIAFDVIKCSDGKYEIAYRNLQKCSNGSFYYRRYDSITEVCEEIERISSEIEMGYR